jgi:para-aminobenzoate synthetase component 1
MKEKVLNWAQQFNTFCFLDNHQYHIKPHTQECLLAAGTREKPFTGSGIAQLQDYINEKKDRWLFGHLNYDLKNELEYLSSHHKDHIQFPEIFFYEPAILISLDENCIRIEADNPAEIFNDINGIIFPGATSAITYNIRIKNKIQKNTIYLS